MCLASGEASPVHDNVAPLADAVCTVDALVVHARVPCRVLRSAAPVSRACLQASARSCGSVRANCMRPALGGELRCSAGEALCMIKTATALDSWSRMG